MTSEFLCVNLKGYCVLEIQFHLAISQLGHVLNWDKMETFQPTKKKKGGTHCLTAIENYGFYLVKTFCSNFFFLSPLRKISKFWNENFILDTSEALPLWIMWGIYSVMQEQIWNEKLPQDKNWKSFVPEMLISLQPLWLWNVYIFLTTISAKSMWVLKSWNWIETVIYVGKF